MAERTWLAIALCCLVWFAYLKWFGPPPPTPIVQHSQSQTTAPEKASAPATANVPFFEQKLVLLDSTSLKNDKMAVEFSDLGGKISQISLSGFHETRDPHSELIQPVTPAATPFSLATLFSDTTLQKLANGTFQRSSSGDAIQYVTTGDGLKIEKSYRLSGDSAYLVDSNITVTFPEGSRNNWGYMVIPVGGTDLQFESSDPLQSWEVVGYQNESVTRKAFNKIKDGDLVQQGNTGWLAFGNRYFSTVVINRDSQINPDVVFSKNAAFQGGYLRFPLEMKAGQKSLTFNLRYYTGPKDYTDLAKVPGLKQLINYGTFSVIAYPILALLRFFYRFCRNYGIAIILLTILFRLLFYPLSAKSARSMKAMQKLQPQIQILKDKYKDDMQKFNQEQMALFKTHKVNPMGGCLPMLLQLPVFIALYAVLGNSIELFHAPFFAWIQDLSAKDPFYILPVLMGVSMFLQQRLTTTPGMDPVQQKMMYFMPVIFTFMMFKLPSGLTLYIFLSTLLGIGQQMSINREREKSEPALVGVRAGAPKT